MQTSIDDPWYEVEDPETVELTVGIEGGGVATHEVPVALLDQEFDTDEQRRRFLLDQIEEMAFQQSISWRESQ